MDPTTERVIAERARTQLGLITTAQLRAAGMSRQAVTRRVASGVLVRVGARTLRVAAAPPGLEVDVLAACLDLDAVASHRTAAWLHGLLPSPGPLVDVTVAKGRTMGSAAATEGLRVHSSTNLPAGHIVRVGAVPTTSVARSLLGLAALDPREIDDECLTSVIEEAVRTRRASDRWLWWLLEERRCRGRNGVLRFEQALARRSALGPTESWLERELLRLIDEAGLPKPAVQRRIGRRGAFVARVDLLYESERVVLEALGYASHSSRAQVSADAARASALQLAGFDVHQLTYDQIVTAPTWTVGVVRAALERAGAALAA